MELAIDALDTVQRYVRIDLAGGNIGMAEDCLDSSQVGAVLHHVRGAAVAEHVWAGVTRRSGSRAYHLPDALPRQAAAAPPHEQHRRHLPVQQQNPSML